MKRKFLSMALAMILVFSTSFITAAAATDDYVIQPGDVLWRIAREYNTTWQELAELNQLENPHLIYAGDTLKITDTSQAEMVPEGDDMASGDDVMADTSLTLRILHTNDHHSHLESNSADLSFDGVETRLSIGGFSNLATIIEEKRNDHTLVLNSGELNGTLYFSLFKGEVDFKVFNALGIDAYALGNHEFDEGDAGLAELIKQANFPIVSTNVQPTEDSPLYEVKDSILPYVIKEIDGEKVAIIGILKVEKTKNSSLASDDLIFTDEIESANATVTELEGMGINKIILLSHVGYYNDFLFAENVAGIDLIIGGDSHTLLGDETEFANVGLAPYFYGQTGPFEGYVHGNYEEENPTIGHYPTIVTNSENEPVYIVTAWEYAKGVGMMDILFSQEGVIESIEGNIIIPVEGPYLQKNEDGDRVEVDAATKEAIENTIEASPVLSLASPSPIVEAVIAPYKEEMKASLETVIGSISTTMSFERIPTPFAAGETPTGSYAGQVVADAFASTNPAIDASIQNVGGVRSELLAGEFTVSDAITVLPFSNTVVMMDMTGQQIINVLNQSAYYSLNSGSTGAFPACSNLRYDVFLSEEEGSVIQNVEIKAKDGTWSDIDLDTYYTIATNSFTALGKDNYLEFATVRETAEGNFEDTYITYYVPLKELIEDMPNQTLPALDLEDYCLKSVTE